jgi:hypothetical protein
MRHREAQAAGQQFPSGNNRVTPGRAPNDTQALDVRDQTLFAGDTFTSYWRTEIPNAAASPHSAALLQPFPLAAMETQDRARIVQSARALRELDPFILLTGHGPAVRSPSKAMEVAIQRATR